MDSVARWQSPPSPLTPTLERIVTLRSHNVRTALAATCLTGLAGATLVATAGPGSAAEEQGGRKLVATLSGANEVSAAGVGGQGDPDGAGVARITVNPGAGTLCWSISASGIDPATRGHIHEAVAGKNGPIVVAFFEGAAVLNGCTSTFNGTSAKEIAKDPANYYVNLHNPAFPAGAVRGQLAK